MNAMDAILNRKSCRSYDGKRIREDELQTILKAGCSAPVARGLYESIHLTVIEDEALLKKIFDKTSELIFKVMNVKRNMDFGAKTLVLISSVMANPSNGMEYTNAGCIAENMCIAATSIGVDNVIMGAPARIIDSELLQCLKVPEGFSPLLCVAFGYALSKEEPKQHTISINRV